MNHHVAAAWLSVLFGLVCLLSWALAGGKIALTIFGGGIVPAIISWGSMAAVIDRAGAFDPKRHERAMLINFFVKVLILGFWTAIVLVRLDWSPAIFSIAMLVNFLVWHLLEAMVYHKQLVSFRASAALGSRENS